MPVHSGKLNHISWLMLSLARYLLNLLLFPVMDVPFHTHVHTLNQLYHVHLSRGERKDLTVDTSGSQLHVLRTTVAAYKVPTTLPCQHSVEKILTDTIHSLQLFHHTKRLKFRSLHCAYLIGVAGALHLPQTLSFLHCSSSGQSAEPTEEKTKIIIGF